MVCIKYFSAVKVIAAQNNMYVMYQHNIQRNGEIDRGRECKVDGTSCKIHGKYSHQLQYILFGEKYLQGRRCAAVHRVTWYPMYIYIYTYIRLYVHAWLIT